MKQAVFLDRDGVISEAIVKNGRCFSPRRFEDFKLYDGIRNVLKDLENENFLTIIVTNQPDITRGLMQQEELERMHDFVRQNLPIDDILVCPHDDSDNCPCRKPRPGMLLEAAAKRNIDMERSFMIGDQSKDMQAGNSAGCTTVLIDRSYNKFAIADFRVEDMSAAKKIILKRNRG